MRTENKKLRYRETTNDEDYFSGNADIALTK
jgi:hypothetical protein